MQSFIGFWIKKYYKGHFQKNLGNMNMLNNIIVCQCSFAGLEKRYYDYVGE